MLEIELKDLLNTVFRGPHAARYADIVIHYAGWDGSGVGTLHETGRVYSLTRERVRQIVTKATTQLGARDYRHRVPSLSQAVKFIERHLPIAAARVRDEMPTLGLSAEPFAPTSLLHAAHTLGFDVSVEVARLEGTTFLVAPGSGDFLKCIRLQALRECGYRGAIFAGDYVDAIPGNKSRANKLRVVKDILETRQDIRWLKDAPGWAYFTGHSRNRVITQARKVLAVAGSVGLDELQDAIERPLNRYSPVKAGLSQRLPIQALRALLLESGEFIEHQGAIRLANEVNESEVLYKAEAGMVAVLREAGGLLRERPFETLCAQQGVSHYGYCMALNSSPVIRRVERGLYTLVGANTAQERPVSV